MRILLRLYPREAVAYENDYHYHLQAFVYSLIRKTGRARIHDRAGYKFFCFSNIFPYQPTFETGQEENLLISGPDSVLVSDLARLIKDMENPELRMGKARFSIKEVDGPFGLDMRAGSSLKLRSSTPIVVRIPAWRYRDYGIKSDRPYVFWRDTISLEAFVKQISDNMEKKIAEYDLSKTDVAHKLTGTREEREGEVCPSKSDLPDVISYRYLKSVSKPITVKGESQQVIGSLWEFEFSPQTVEMARNLEFVADCGFGERNPLGFGFMNTR